MSADWIKVEKITQRKPEVLVIAELLKVTQDHAFGLCIRFWMWCDTHLLDGEVENITPKMLNKVLGQNRFAEAMMDVGWITFEGGFLRVINFDKHMSQSAKARAEDQLRQKEHREAKKKVSQSCHKKSVTNPLPEIERDKDKDINTPPTPKGGMPPPIPNPDPTQAAVEESSDPEPGMDLIPAEADLSPEGELAHAWTASRAGVGWRVPAGETYPELLVFFREKLRVGKNPHTIRAAIDSPTRDRTEKLWQFSRRELESPVHAPQNRITTVEDAMAATLEDPIQKRSLEIAFHGWK